MSKKQQIRANFRKSVFERDGWRCRICGKNGFDRQETPISGKVPIDSHHIISRKSFKFGGYVESNGISLCDECHLAAEEYLTTGTGESKFSPENLYKLIGSSEEKAHLDDH